MSNHEILNHVPKLRRAVMEKMEAKRIKPYQLSRLSKTDVAIVYRFLNKDGKDLSFNSAYKFMKALDISFEDLEKEDVNQPTKGENNEIIQII